MARKRTPTAARKERENFGHFAGLISAPGDLVAGVTLPAACDAYLATDAILAAPTALVELRARVVNSTSTQRKLGGRAGAAGTRTHVGTLEGGLQVKKTAGAPGLLSLYVRDPAGVTHKIAGG